MENDGKQRMHCIPRQVSDRWTFDVETLMPLGSDDLEALQQNTVVQIWLRRVQKRRAATSLSKERHCEKKSMTWKPAANLVVDMRRLTNIKGSAKQIKEGHNAIFSSCTGMEAADPTSVEALLAKPFSVQDCPELKPILCNGEACAEDLWILSKRYWLEAMLDPHEFGKWASMATKQYSRVRKAAGCTSFQEEVEIANEKQGKGSQKAVFSKLDAVNAFTALQSIEVRRMERGSIPFAVPIPPDHPSQKQGARPLRRGPS
jgi:hypothetical protein